MAARTPPDLNAIREDVLRFWFEEATRQQWFVRDDSFDETIRTRFGAIHTAASEGALSVLEADPKGALALILILDQFSRNLFRDDARAFAQDARALEIAKTAIERRFDRVAPTAHQAFFFMPFMHSENLADQQRCVDLFEAHLPGTMNVPFAIEHRDIIARYGRFPHRNKILGRTSGQTEVDFLKAGGFNP